MIRPGLCDSYKVEILKGIHRDTHTYALALYSEDADLSARTTTYTKAGEVSGEGYPSGGVLLSGASITLHDGVACLDFDDVNLKRATISAGGGLIYNLTADKRAVAVVRFPGVMTSTNGPFEIEMPPVGASSSVVQIA
jgi:hypothetical protein